MPNYKSNFSKAYNRFDPNEPHTSKDLYNLLVRLKSVKPSNWGDPVVILKHVEHMVKVKLQQEKQLLISFMYIFEMSTIE